MMVCACAYVYVWETLIEDFLGVGSHISRNGSVSCASLEYFHPPLRYDFDGRGKWLKFIIIQAAVNQ